MKKKAMRVILTGNQNPACYADQSNYCWLAPQLNLKKEFNYGEFKISNRSSFYAP